MPLGRLNNIKLINADIERIDAPANQPICGFLAQFPGDQNIDPRIQLAIETALSEIYNNGNLEYANNALKSRGLAVPSDTSSTALATVVLDPRYLTPNIYGSGNVPLKVRTPLIGEVCNLWRAVKASIGGESTKSVWEISSRRGRGGRFPLAIPTVAGL